MGLVIAVFTYFAVIYMADDPPVVEEFVVSPWNKIGRPIRLSKGRLCKHENVFYVSNIEQNSPSIVPGEKDSANSWNKVDGIPHQFTWKVSTGDLIEINSLQPGNPFFHQYHPSETDNIEGSKIALLAQSALLMTLGLKVRSDAFWVEV